MRSRRGSRRSSGLKRSPDWAAYHFSATGGISADPGFVTTFIDWFKLPAGVADVTTGDLEPRDDTLLGVLAWGGDALTVDSLATQVGPVNIFIGLIEWMGNTDVPPDAADQMTPVPGSYPQAEWIWWYKAGGVLNVPANLVTTINADTSDWHRRSSAKRKLPENMGILLVGQIAVGSEFADPVIWYPDWMFRYIVAAGSHLKARR